MPPHRQAPPDQTRLRTMAECVPRGSHVVDVGSDHGLLPRLLLRERRARACIATERQPGGPLQGLAGLDPLLAVRFGDGLAALGPDDPVDVVVIGGMGARSIIRILDQGRERLVRVTRLVLQPQSEWPRLRGWLSSNDFRLVDERLVAERGRDYLVLVAEPGVAKLPIFAGLTADDLLEAGPVLVRDRSPTTIAHWHDRERRARRAARECAGLDAPTRERLAAGWQQARRILAALGEPLPDP